MKARQRGASCFLCLVVILIVLFFSLSGLKIVQSYLQNMEISRVLSATAKEAKENNLSDADIRSDYSRRASVADIPEVKVLDIDIDRRDGGVVLSAIYSVTLPVVANASLVLEYKPSSEGK